MILLYFLVCLGTSMQWYQGNQEPLQRAVFFPLQSTETKITEVNDFEFVLVKDYIPDIVVDLKYATTENFTGEIIYDFQEAYLRYGTVKKLAKAQEELHKQGLGLKIWDAYRPFSAQEKLWSVYPDGNYVANPAKGYTSHNLGNTVDITLVDMQGNELEMPTEFDNFTKAAHRDYSSTTETAKQNALLLQNIMEQYGFHGYKKEWWDYQDNDNYAPEDFQPKKTIF